MKSFCLVPLIALSATMLSATVSIAQTTKIDSTRWREVQPKYEFKHPVTVTCQEFLDTEAIYRPYVVAWLSGRSIGATDIENPDDFVPVSVPQVVTTCTEEPDTLVYEVIEVISAD